MTSAPASAPHRRALVAGRGHVPGHESRRPAEVVFDAPSTSPAQLDLAVSAAAGLSEHGPRWSGGARGDRRAAAEAGVAAVERHDLARLLTGSTARRTSRRSSTPPPWGHGGGFAPLVAEALAARDVSRGPPDRVGPHGVVAAVLPFNCGVGHGQQGAARPAGGRHGGVKAPPSCPGTVLLVAAAMAEVLPPRPQRRERASAALGAALVGHPGVDMVSFTGGVGTGRPSWPRRPHDQARRAGTRRQRRRHPRPRRRR